MDQLLLVLLGLNLMAVAALWWRGRRGDVASAQLTETERRLTSAIRDSAKSAGEAQTNLGVTLTKELTALRGETTLLTTRARPPHSPSKHEHGSHATRSSGWPCRLSLAPSYRPRVAD